MEPGHEDREYVVRRLDRIAGSEPQWSPVMKTGNTCEALQRDSVICCLNGARS